MPTAIGTYATLATAKERLGIPTGDTDSDDLIEALCDQVNAWIEQTTGRVLAPLEDTEVLVDGLTAIDERHLPVPFGLNGPLTLQIATYTGGSFATVASGDYFLRPTAINRRTGWPALVIVLSDRPTGSGPRAFYPGYGNVKLTGSAGFAGWPAIPDEVAELALTAVVRAWNARAAGQADIVGTDEMGRPIVSRYVSARDRATLDGYCRYPKVAGGPDVVI